MGAYVKVMKEEDYATLMSYLEDDGVVLITEETAERLKEETGKELDGSFIDDYDFGGEADKFIDIVHSEEHYFCKHLKARKVECSAVPDIS